MWPVRQSSYLGYVTLYQSSCSTLFRYTHTANMTGLKPSTRYYYRVKSASGETSKTFTFKTQPDATTIATDLPEVHLAYGDMGA